MNALLYLTAIFGCSFVAGQDPNIANQTSIPIDISSTDTIIQDEIVTMRCVECTVKGELLLSAGCGDSICSEDDRDIPNANFSMLPFDFEDNNWAVASLRTFSVHIEVEFVLQPSTESNPRDISLIGSNGISIGNPIRTLFGIEVNFQPVIHGVFNSSAPANFTYGFEFELPDNSAVYFGFDPLDLSSIVDVEQTGFNETSIRPLNYTSPDPADDFDFTLSFRPQLGVNVSFLEDATEFLDLPNIEGGAQIFADVPQLDVSVSQVRNVTRDCQPATPGTDEKDIFDSLTYVVPTISYDLGFDIELPIFDPGEVVIPLGNGTSLATSCLDYSNSTSDLTAVPESADEEGMGTEDLAQNETENLAQSLRHDLGLMVGAAILLFVSFL